MSGSCKTGVMSVSIAGRWMGLAGAQHSAHLGQERKRGEQVGEGQEVEMGDVVKGLRFPCLRDVG